MPRRRNRVDQRRPQTMTRRRPAEEVERLLTEIPTPVARKLRLALTYHFKDPSLRDRRGRRRSSELHRALTTLRHVAGLLRWVNDDRYDLNCRRKFKKFLKHIVHGQPWQVTVDEGRTARGLANRAGRRWNETRVFGPPSEAVPIAENHMVFPLNTIAKLRSAGRRAENCLQTNDHGHHDALRRGEVGYFEIRREGAAEAWMSVDCESRRVVEIWGPRNDEADLPDDVLWQLCRKLRISGDEAELFIRRGVLSMFVDGAADAQDPQSVVAAYRLWSRRGEVVLQHSKEGRWSRFVWEGREWEATRASHVSADALKVLRDVSPRVRLLVTSAETARTGRKRARRRRRR